MGGIVSRALYIAASLEDQIDRQRMIDNAAELAKIANLGGRGNIVICEDESDDDGPDNVEIFHADIVEYFIASSNEIPTRRRAVMVGM